jgi:transcriptional regulator with XRE-family HTH domain
MTTAMAVFGRRQYIVAMATTLTRTVIAAVRAAPCSDRALAAAAGVPPSTLARLRTGEREATVAVAQAIAGALDRWSADCASAAWRVRRAVGGPRTPRRRR